jgi:uncharacterized protein (DUF924 family)
MRVAASEVLDFWFGGDLGLYRPAWFDKDPAFDASVRTRFEDLWREASEGAHDTWLDAPSSALALVVVLDQFPRNMFRGGPAMYASDAQARVAARAMLARGFDLVLPAMARIFAYLPFEHSEDMADQVCSLRLFAGLAFDPARVRSLESARRHHEIVLRFGRFPHRNAVLGRETTAEEAAFLLEPNSSF